MEGNEKEASRAHALFDRFVQASTCKGTLRAFQELCDHLELKPRDYRCFYHKLKSKLNYWKAKALWAKLDKRGSHKDYKKGKACVNTKVRPGPHRAELVPQGALTPSLMSLSREPDLVTTCFHVPSIWGFGFVRTAPASRGLSALEPCGDHCEPCSVRGGAPVMCWWDLARWPCRRCSVLWWRGRTVVPAEGLVLKSVPVSGGCEPDCSLRTPQPVETLHGAGGSGQSCDAQPRVGGRVGLGEALRFLRSSLGGGASREAVLQVAHGCVTRVLSRAVFCPDSSCLCSASSSAPGPVGSARPSTCPCWAPRWWSLRSETPSPATTSCTSGHSPSMTCGAWGPRSSMGSSVQAPSTTSVSAAGLSAWVSPHGAGGHCAWVLSPGLCTLGMSARGSLWLCPLSERWQWWGAPWGQVRVQAGSDGLDLLWLSVLWERYRNTALYGDVTEQRAGERAEAGGPQVWKPQARKQPTVGRQRPPRVHDQWGPLSRVPLYSC